MGNISVRLPEEVEAILEHEAHLSHRSRSELVREAITEYVTRKEKQRFLDAMAAAATALAKDADARAEALAVTEAFLEDGMDRNDDESGGDPVGQTERWGR